MFLVLPVETWLAGCHCLRSWAQAGCLTLKNTHKLARQYYFRNLGHQRDESVGVRWKIGRLHRLVVDWSITHYQTVSVTFKLVQTFQI